MMLGLQAVRVQAALLASILSSIPGHLTLLLALATMLPNPTVAGVEDVQHFLSERSWNNNPFLIQDHRALCCEVLPGQVEFS